MHGTYPLVVMCTYVQISKWDEETDDAVPLPKRARRTVLDEAQWTM
ncbi:hypothetical protein TSMEX_004024 [Taenia solium]|eukprot:TsM_000371800 transcript=TsM_000371800 gene=TsM_000371800